MQPMKEAAVGVRVPYGLARQLESEVAPAFIDPGTWGPCARMGRF
jgi:hypothetical protein